MRIREDRHVHDLIFFLVTCIFVLWPWPYSPATFFTIWQRPKYYMPYSIPAPNDRAAVAASQEKRPKTNDYYVVLAFFESRAIWMKTNIRASVWRLLWIVTFTAILAGWNFFNVNFEIEHFHGGAPDPPEGEADFLHAALEDSDYLTVNILVTVSVLFIKFMPSCLEYYATDSALSPLAVLMVFATIAVSIVTGVFLWAQQAWVFFALWLMLPLTLVFTLWILYLMNMKYTAMVTMALAHEEDGRKKKHTKKNKRNVEDTLSE